MPNSCPASKRNPGYGLLLGLAAAMLLLSPAAAQVETTDPAAADPGVVTGTLAQIKKAGTVRLGYRDASIPFSFLDPFGRPVGYSIDICTAIVEEIGRTLDREDLRIAYVKVTSETRLQAIVDAPSTSNAARPPTTRSAARWSISHR